MHFIPLLPVHQAAARFRAVVCSDMRSFCQVKPSVASATGAACGEAVVEADDSIVLGVL
ncbi:MAG: hypothetical protein HZC01_03485 [Candidatus Kerfeldbacteria bacterium]|nr:hypothetical protein [Candidatus Kerfeldbacteria bacterium]